MRIFPLLPLLLVSACVSYRGAPPNTDVTLPEKDYSVQREVTYTPADWPQALQADIYAPEGLGPFPAVLVVHGGGWERGERQDMDFIAERLARAGFVAVNISYRFAPATTFPGQVYDLQQALHFMHAQARLYRIDTARIGAFGYSAGAHLVALLGTISDGDALDAPYGGADTRLKAVVAGGTPSDLRKFEGGRLVPQFLGGDQTQVPQVYAQASPVTHVSPDDPPFFLYHGGLDMLVSVDHATDFKAALEAAGVHCEFYELNLQGHITTFLGGGAAVKQGIRFLSRELR